MNNLTLHLFEITESYVVEKTEAIWDDADENVVDMDSHLVTNHYTSYFLTTPLGAEEVRRVLEAIQTYYGKRYSYSLGFKEHQIELYSNSVPLAELRRMLPVGHAVPLEYIENYLKETEYVSVQSEPDDSIDTATDDDLPF